MKNDYASSQPHKFNLVISAILILTVLILWIYDGTAQKGLFSCPDFILFLLLSYGVAAASVYLTGYLNVVNSYLRAGGALGVLALCFLLLFYNYDRICNSTITPAIEKTQYEVKIIPSSSPHAATNDRLSLTLWDVNGQTQEVYVDSLEVDKAVVLVTRGSLEAPIESVSIELKDINQPGLNKTFLTGIEIKEVKEIDPGFYTVIFPGQVGTPFGAPPNHNNCKFSVQRNQEIIFRNCNYR